MIVAMTHQLHSNAVKTSYKFQSLSSNERLVSTNRRSKLVWFQLVGQRGEVEDVARQLA